VPAALQPADEVAPHQDVLEFEGGLTGVGYVTPVETGFVGISSRAQRFEVGEHATRLTAVLTWDVPAVVYLSVHDGQRSRFYDHQSPEDALENSVSFETTDVQADRWLVMVWAQGPAVVEYRITVTIDYAA
jgi:hypothetical protein